MSERKKNKDLSVGIVMAMPSISPHVPSVQVAMVVLFYNLSRAALASLRFLGYMQCFQRVL